MKADTRTMRKTAYRNSVYVQGNTARKLNALPQIEQPVRRVDEKTARRTHRNRARALRMNVGNVLFLSVAMLAAGMILTMYLSLQSDITNSIKNISKQEKLLNDLRLDNDENYSRITSSVNLEEVKRIAIQELGMGYAVEGQIITFNGESSDYVRQTGELPD